MYKLLIVDDDQEFVSYLEKNLLSKYQVFTAYDGEEALVKLKECNPDIVLLDLMLPKLNGFEILKIIRKESKDKWLPVIIISTRTELEAMKHSYDLEADHYLTKPVRLENLHQAIETLISLIPLREREN